MSDACGDSHHSNQTTASSSPSLLQVTATQRPKESSQLSSSATTYSNGIISSGETSPSLLKYWETGKSEFHTESDRQVHADHMNDMVLRMSKTTLSAEEDSLRLSRKNSSSSSLNTFVAQPDFPASDQRKDWETGSNSSGEAEGQLLEVCIGFFNTYYMECMIDLFGLEWYCYNMGWELTRIHH